MFKSGSKQSWSTYTLIAFRWFSLPKINISLNHENTPPSFFFHVIYLLKKLGQVSSGISHIWGLAPSTWWCSHALPALRFPKPGSECFDEVRAPVVPRAGALCGSWATLTTASHWAARDAWLYLFYSHVNNVYVAIMEFLFYDLFISQYFPLVLLIFLL